MASDDPWRDISAAHASQINARRVTQATPWGLYWAVDAERNVLLILQHRGTIRRSRRLPRLRGLWVEAQPADGGSDERIVIRLTDQEQRDIFLRFCRDIVDATVLAQTEEQAVERFLARTWRWHRLLQGGRDKRLGDDEQRGLIGELVVLERHLLPVLGALDAVRCWTGPLDAPHDFEISRIHVEAKAQGFRNTPRDDFLRTSARVGQCRQAVSPRHGGDHRGRGRTGRSDGDRHRDQNPCRVGRTGHGRRRPLRGASGRGRIRLDGRLLGQVLGGRAGGPL